MAEDYKALLGQAEGHLRDARNSLSFQSYDESIVSCHKALDRALHALCAFHNLAAPPTGAPLERLCATVKFTTSDPAILEMLEKAYTERPEKIARDYSGERVFSAGEAAQALRFATDTAEAIRKRIEAKSRR